MSKLQNVPNKLLFLKNLYGKLFSKYTKILTLVTGYVAKDLTKFYRIFTRICKTIKSLYGDMFGATKMKNLFKNYNDNIKQVFGSNVRETLAFMETENIKNLHLLGKCQTDEHGIFILKEEHIKSDILIPSYQRKVTTTSKEVFEDITSLIQLVASDTKELINRVYCKVKFYDVFPENDGKYFIPAEMIGFDEKMKLVTFPISYRIEQGVIYYTPKIDRSIGCEFVLLFDEENQRARKYPKVHRFICRERRSREKTGRNG